jgi:hypothetical protein
VVPQSVVLDLRYETKRARPYALLSTLCEYGIQLEHTDAWNKELGLRYHHLPGINGNIGPCAHWPQLVPRTDMELAPIYSQDCLL